MENTRVIGISEGMVLAERYRLVRRHEDLGTGEFWGGVAGSVGACRAGRHEQWTTPRRAGQRIRVENEVLARLVAAQPFWGSTFLRSPGAGLTAVAPVTP